MTDISETEANSTDSSEEESELPDESVITRPQSKKRLKPDPEDAQLSQEAILLDEPDWVEKCFDADYEHPKFNRTLARFLEKGYVKLGRKLGQELVSEGLSMVAKTISGLHYTFVKLDLIGKAIVEIALLKNFAHLRYVFLAGNHISDIKPLNHLQFLMVLDISDNYLQSMGDFNVHIYLRNLNVSKNFLKELKGVIEHPYLQRLYLSYNKLSYFSLESPKHLRELETLELRKNRLKTFGDDDLKLPALKSLFLAQNCLERLGKFHQIKKLEFLDLRRNKLKSLSECELVNLCYLNLSWNFITELYEIDRLVLAAPKIRTLIIKNNSVNGNEKTQTRAIIYFKNLTRLNALMVTKEIREEATEEFAEEQEDEQGESNKENET